MAVSTFRLSLSSSRSSVVTPATKNNGSPKGDLSTLEVKSFINAQELNSGVKMFSSKIHPPNHLLLLNLILIWKTLVNTKVSSKATQVSL